MRRILIICTMGLLTTVIHAQDPPPVDPGWQWALRGGSIASLGPTNFERNNERILDVAVDNDNNYYFLAEVGGFDFTLDTMEFDTRNRYSDRTDIFLFSTDEGGNFRWSKTIGGGGPDWASSLEIDDEGGVYVCGTVNNMRPPSEPVAFDTDTIMPQGTIGVSEANKQLFLIKYNSEGHYQWLRQPQDSSEIGYRGMMLRMVVEGNGTIHCLAAFAEGSYFGGQLIIPPIDTIGSILNTREAILKYDSEGELLSYSLLDMVPDVTDYNFEFAYDPELDRYYIGDTQRAYGPSIPPLSINGHGADTESAFYLAAVDNQGEVLWHHENQKFGTHQLGGIKLDPEGNIYFTGLISGPDSFAGQFFDPPGGNTSRNNPFLVKLDSDGNLIWGSCSDLSSGFPGQDIVLRDNSVYLGLGMLYNTWGDLEIPGPLMAGWVPDIQIIRFDAETGAPQEVIGNNMLTPSRDYIMAMALDNAGDLVVGGYFGSHLFAGSDLHIHNNAQGSDFFAAKYCPAPRAAFTIDTLDAETGTYAFTLEGSDPYIDSVSWTFGDGTTAWGTHPQHAFPQNGTYTVCATAYNHCRSDTVCAELSVDGIVSASAVRGPNTLRAYPNPTSGTITLNPNLDFTSHTIRDLRGRRVAAGSLPNNRVDLTELEDGVYLLEVRTASGEVWNGKVVKGE